MKTLFGFLFFLSFSCLLTAQSFAGEYALRADNGEVVLLVQDDGQNRVSGMLTDSDNTHYQMEAVIEQKYIRGAVQKYARGRLSNSSQNLYFEAHRIGEQLVLTIMPFDAYNQPDYLKATDFTLTRRERKKAPIELTTERPEENSPPFEEAKTSGGGIWDGVYHGNANDVATRLDIRRYGNQLSGEINAGEYRYILEGAISGGEAWGEVVGLQAQEKMRFTGTLDKDLVLLTFSGEDGRFNMQFLREGAEPPASKKNGNGLPGSWLYSQAPRSGEFAPPRQLLLVLHPNGTFQYGEAKAVRADPDGKGIGRGRWGTKDDVIMISQNGQWKKMATFQLKGDSLFLQFETGTPQEWKRVD